MVAPGAAQFVFEVGECLFEPGHFLFLVVDGLKMVVEVAAVVLLAKRHVGVAIVLLLHQVELALEDVKFLFRSAELSPRFGEALAPVGLAFGFFWLSYFLLGSRRYHFFGLGYRCLPLRLGTRRTTSYS